MSDHEERDLVRLPGEPRKRNRGGDNTGGYIPPGRGGLGAAAPRCACGAVVYNGHHCGNGHVQVRG